MERPELVEHTLSFLIRRLHDAGIEATATVDPTTDQSALVLEDGGLLSVENLVNELAVSAPATHTERIERWVAFVIEFGRVTKTPITDPDELRGRVRTRILAPDLAANTHFSYTRPFPGGLALGLCLDFPSTVTTITDNELAQLPLPADELFHYGQINTDNEPIDESACAGPFTGIAGESLFIASKAAHVANLVATLHIDAPHGLFLSIPERSVLLYAPADPSSITQQYLRLLDYLRIDFMRRFQATPSHTLSKDLFYCAPDGEFGVITRGNHPDVQELFTTPNLAADRLVELAVKNMNFFDGFRSRFYPSNMS